MFTASTFGEILKLLPRAQISKLVGKRNADHRRKSFLTWDHLVAMLGAQLSGVGSLRDVENLFDAHRSAHYHLHSKGVKKSTLGDANKNRDYQIFADIAQLLIAGANAWRGKTKQLLSALDSSPIQLDGRGHEWADQGLKLHLLLTPSNGAIDYAQVTDMNVNDITDAQSLPLEAGRIYVFD